MAQRTQKRKDREEIDFKNLCVLCASALFALNPDSKPGRWLGGARSAAPDIPIHKANTENIMTEPQRDQGVVFNLEKIYVKDVSFESPNAPQSFLEQTAPEVGVQLGISHGAVNGAEDIHEVVLDVTVNARLKDKPVFLVNVQQAGLFRVQGVPADEMPKVMEIACPAILLPFVREVVNELCMKGGFPQLLINPVNFEALYQQKHAPAQGVASH